MTYDIIFAGSGALHILEAVHQVRLGKKILIIEEKNQTLGAWGTIEHPLFGKVETGCHIMERYNGVYDFLENTLQIPFDPMIPGPEMIRRNKRMPYDWKWNLYIAKSFFNHARKLKFKEFRKLKKENQWEFNFVKQEYKCPKGGSPSFTDAFQKLIDQHKIEIRFNTKINQLKFSDRIWSIQTDKEPFSAKNIQLTSLSEIEEINYNHLKIFPIYRNASYQHLHLLLETKVKKPLNYLRIIGNPFIHRISDISNQLSEKLPENQHLYLIGINDYDEKSIQKKEYGKIAAELLQKAGNISTFQILNEHYNSYYCKYHQQETLKEVEKMEGISFLHSTNFTHAIYLKLNEWTKTN